MFICMLFTPAGELTNRLQYLSLSCCVYLRRCCYTLCTCVQVCVRVYCCVVCNCAGVVILCVHVYRYVSGFIAVLCVQLVVDWHILCVHVYRYVSGFIAVLCVQLVVDWLESCAREYLEEVADNVKFFTDTSVVW